MIWKPNTCNCVIDYDNKKIITHCISHNNFNEVVIHNQSFNYKYGKGKELTQTQIEFLKIAKHEEKKKLKIKE